MFQCRKFRVEIWFAGGTFALYSLICRFAGMRPATNGIPDASDVTLSRYSRHTGDKGTKSLSTRISFGLKQYLATTVGAQASLLCLVLLMTSMVLGDGVLTPAQSVLGAIYGLQVKTSVSQGTEATYADLGHFSRSAIRISFLVICYPVLIVTYLGQAAWLTRYPDQVSSTFYASIPYGDGFYWFVFVFATGAACVASQAMISAAFSIVKQSIALGCFPQLSVQHVSDKVLGSVYIPEVNYVMMVLTVVVIAIFKTTVQLGNAYGVAVSSMMFGTTVLIYVVMLMIWETNFFLATAFLISFGFIDMVFTTANLNKVPHGGWFALAIAGAVFSLSYLWWWGTNIKHKSMLATQMKMQDLLGTNLIYNKSKKDDASSPDDSVDESLTGPGPCSNSPQAEDNSGISSPKLVTGNDAAPANGPHDQLVLASSGQPLLRIPAVGIMFADTLYGAPTILPELVNRWGVVHKVLIILTIRQVAVSTVSESERLLFRKLRYPGIYRCVARYGYRDRVHMDNKFVIKLLDKVNEVDPSVAHVVQQANVVNTSYIVSFIKLFVKQDIVGIKGAFRRFFLQDVYSNMGRFVRHSYQDWCIPHGSLFEVGVALNV
ncbi:Potassium transporter [Trebouxia sp. C0009 RCD-2024]